MTWETRIQLFHIFVCAVVLWGLMQNYKVSLLPKTKRTMQNVTSQKWEKCQPFWLKWGFLYAKKSGLCCSTQCVLLQSQECGERVRGGARGWHGPCPLTPVVRTCLSCLQSRGGERWQFPPVSLGTGSLGLNRHRFIQSPFQWQFRVRMKKNVTQSLIRAPLEKKWGAETAYSSWGLSCVLFSQFSAHFGQRGWLRCNGLNIPCIKGGKIRLHEF